MKTLTKGLADYVVGGRNLLVPSQSCAVRWSYPQRLGVRRYWTLLLTLLCGLILAGCAMPEAIPTQSDPSDQNAKVDAIQTRIAETRDEQASTQEDSMAEVSDGAQDQTGAVEEADSGLTPGPTAEQLELLAKLRPQGEAPELLNEVWLNSDPLKLVDLRGKVVLVEFWTYG